MKKLILASALVVSSFGCAEAQAPKLPVPPVVQRVLQSLPPVATNWASAVEQARTRRRYILLFYTASWCGPCRTLHAGLAPREQFLRTNFVEAVIDIDIEKPLKHLDVQSVPAYFIVDTHGTVLNAGSGLMSENDFITWLNSTQYPKGK